MDEIRPIHAALCAVLRQWNAAYRAGRPWCWAAPMADGAYTAKHCLDDPGPRSWDGTAAVRYSADTDRDLGHVQGETAPAQGLAQPADRDTGRWCGRAEGAVRFVSRSLETWHGQNQWLDRWCVTAGKRIKAGDSGSGVWRDDGALVGVVVGISWDTWSCPDSQTILAVGVP